VPLGRVPKVAAGAEDIARGVVATMVVAVEVTVVGVDMAVGEAAGRVEVENPADSLPLFGTYERILPIFPGRMGF
jgi:hypothetical protein